VRLKNKDIEKTARVEGEMKKVKKRRE